MERIPEPELMNDPAQALAYARADFEEPNGRFVETWQALFGDPAGRLLDIGCGPGDITLRFARGHPGLEVHGLDGATEMLRLGRDALAREPALAGRVVFLEGRVPDVTLPAASYQGLVSNSLLHHLHDPRGLWDLICRHGAPGAAVLVMDLFRPASVAEAARIVGKYAAEEPEVLRRDFHNSLLAAFTVEEVRAQLEAARLHSLSVQQASDRHLLVSGYLPG